MRIGLDITVLNETRRTGVGVYTYELINALIKLDREDKFICTGLATLSTEQVLRGLSFLASATKFPNVEVKIRKLPAKSFRTLFLSWQKMGYPKIEHLIGSVDIYHSFNFYLPPQKDGKVVATIFDLTSILHPEWHLGKTSQLDIVRFDQIKKRADLVLAISEHAKQDFLKYSPESHVEVIYPAAREFFSPKKNVKKNFAVLSKYGLESGYFLSVATLEPRKNIAGLIEAYLMGEFQEKLVLVGKLGWKNEEVEKLINENKDKIIVTGFVEDEELVTFYQEALCMIYPSFYEGFGIPPLEAMACGCPVILSDVSSLPEVGGKAVLYIDPNDSKTIYTALKKIQEDKSLRVELSKAGLIQAKTFSWEISAKKLVRLYKKL
jgi:glycosyltransferase involved in cell wall biosynthesis